MRAIKWYSVSSGAFSFPKRPRRNFRIFNLPKLCFSTGGKRFHGKEVEESLQLDITLIIKMLKTGR